MRRRIEYCSGLGNERCVVEHTISWLHQFRLRICWERDPEIHVIDALRMQIEDLEREISEYEDLKEGRLLSFGADDLDSLGELITKARIACGLTQAELGELLGMTQQQVARYERDGWQKISVWRLAEAADALGLDVNIRARLPASSTARAAGVG